MRTTLPPQPTLEIDPPQRHPCSTSFASQNSYLANSQKEETRDLAKSCCGDWCSRPTSGDRTDGGLRPGFSPGHVGPSLVKPEHYRAWDCSVQSALPG